MDKIRLGEDSLLELKEVRMSGNRILGPDRNDLADELSAFGNSRGGVCVLGVEDKTREVLGIAIEHLDRVETLVRDICNDSIKPPLAVTIERMTLPSPSGGELPVLKVEVSRSLFVHRSPGGYFLRVGSSRREMSPDYLARLFQQRSQTRIIRFEEQTVPCARLDDLEQRLWKRFAPQESGAEAPEITLSKLGLARQDDDGFWRPTVSGILMASNDPRRFLPNAFIQAVAYGGRNATGELLREAYQIDASDISGPLDRQVTEALHFVAKNMRVAAIKNIGRRDFPQYDLTAVFEALVNAVAHRDYAIPGSKIRLRVLGDQLELFSPGALANTMTVESLPLRQSARNEVLTSLLARCPVPTGVGYFDTPRSTMMDKRGEGVRVILDRTRALAGREPEFTVLDGEELLLTIPAAAVPSGLV